MTHPALLPLAAFDIREAHAVPVSENWPSLASTTPYRWLHLDLNAPTTEQWATDHLPDIAANALCQAETRPRCERLENGLVLNLRGVNLNPDSDPEDMVSVRMWITEHTVVSAVLRKVWAVDAIQSATEANAAPASVGQFLIDLTHGLTNRIETVSLALEEQTDELEEAISEGQSLPSDKLGRLRQAVIKMRRFINPQREAIAILASLREWIFSDDELALLRETANRTRRIVEELDATRDRLSALQDHIEADRVNALSRNSYVLSVVAAIFLPLGFFTGLFGVNVAGMPGTGDPSAFWILTIGSVLAGLGLYLIFKFSKWL
ncbi:MAG: zinc transporter ZntB [Rhodospirillaceae bacterium]